MKKVVRMLGLCALVALAFTSCKKNETNGALTFKASITQPKSDDRTYVNLNNWLSWNSGDQIKVFDNSSANYDFTVSTIGSQQSFEDSIATFNVTEAAKVAFLKDIATPGKYVAFYPQAQYNQENNTVSMTIPAVQYFNDANNYEVGSFVANTYPMFGVNDDANHFRFHSHAGVLQFNFAVIPDRYVKVKQIVVSKFGAELVGTMTYPKDYPFSAYDPEAEVYVKSDCDTIVTLDCGDGIELTNTYRRFQMALLRDALNEGFHVQVIGVKDDPLTHEIDQSKVETIFEMDATIEDNDFKAEKLYSMRSRYIPQPGQGNEPVGK
jgi:hypothetical protein